MFGLAGHCGRFGRPAIVAIVGTRFEGFPRFSVGAAQHIFATGFFERLVNLGDHLDVVFPPSLQRFKGARLLDHGEQRRGGSFCRGVFRYLAIEIHNSERSGRFGLLSRCVGRLRRILSPELAALGDGS